MSTINLPNLTAMIVGYNEGHLLGDCLKSVEFCGRIMYFDLGSVDDSTRIAEACGAEVTIAEKVPYGEFVRARYISRVHSEWVLITDPDERVDSVLAAHILHQWPQITSSQNIGGVRVPIQFYFKGKALRGTPWGGTNSRLLLLRKDAFEFTETVHGGERLKPGFTIHELSAGIVDHYWSESYASLIKKHVKYLKHEGEKFDPDKPVALWQILASPLFEFGNAYIYARGYRDGLHGFLLSLVWSWYHTSARYLMWRSWKRASSRFN